MTPRFSRENGSCFIVRINQNHHLNSSRSQWTLKRKLDLKKGFKFSHSLAIFFQVRFCCFFKASRSFFNPSDNMFDTCHGAPEPQNFLIRQLTKHLREKINATVAPLKFNMEPEN